MNKRCVVACLCFIHAAEAHCGHTCCLQRKGESVTLHLNINTYIYIQ